MGCDYYKIIQLYDMDNNAIIENLECVGMYGEETNENTTIKWETNGFEDYSYQDIYTIYEKYVVGIVEDNKKIELRHEKSKELNDEVLKLKEAKKILNNNLLDKYIELKEKENDEFRFWFADKKLIPHNIVVKKFESER